ncbi:unnamed protein product [Lactuca saligna]|uniref:Uncharacterized protein n=1 Tax=Lactuca saligna TaxID=75948 RepID=A0AA36ELL8_LACSI|nr:unnamed protein product [Lactuca saligna]
MKIEHESDSFGGNFENLEFDEEEANIPDHMLMKMKQFKILNTKLNSILQSQVDLGGGNFVTSLEVDGLLKLLEGRITSKVSGMNNSPFPNGGDLMADLEEALVKHRSNHITGSEMAETREKWIESHI